MASELLDANRLAGEFSEAFCNAFTDVIAGGINASQGEKPMKTAIFSLRKASSSPFFV